MSADAHLARMPSLPIEGWAVAQVELDRPLSAWREPDQVFLLRSSRCWPLVTLSTASRRGDGESSPLGRAGLSAEAFAGVTRVVLEAAVAGEAVGAGLAGRWVSKSWWLMLAWGIGRCRARCRRGLVGRRGDLVVADGLSEQDVDDLLAAGQPQAIWWRWANTTVAAALTAGLLGLDAATVVGVGAGADTEMLDRKVVTVAAALDRARGRYGAGPGDPRVTLAALDGPEFVVLAGVILGAASGGAVVVLDGLATSVAALVAVGLEPAVAAHLIAGQQSREAAHGLVLRHLGLEPLLDLRIRAGEGVGACLAVGLLRCGLQLRREAAQTSRDHPY